MSQPLLILLVSVITSIFFGIISNWIYDLLRDYEYLPQRPTVKLVVILVLVSGVFILLMLDQNQIFAELVMIATRSIYLPVWLVICMLIFTGITGYLVRKLVFYKTERRLHNMRKELQGQEEALRQARHFHLENKIINPE